MKEIPLKTIPEILGVHGADCRPVATLRIVDVTDECGEGANERYLFLYGHCDGLWVVQILEPFRGVDDRGMTIVFFLDNLDRQIFRVDLRDNTFCSWARKMGFKSFELKEKILKYRPIEPPARTEVWWKRIFKKVVAFA